MPDSLREQLRKAGLATKKQAKAAEHEMRQRAKQARKQQAPDEAPSDAEVIAEEAAKARREKAARDKELNRRREEERIRREAEAQVRDWLTSHRIAHFKGSVAHHFADAGRVKQLEVTEEIHHALATGRLAVATLDGQYVVIPAAVAEKIIERAPEYVVLLNAPPSEGKREEYGDEFAVPDDLMW